MIHPHAEPRRISDELGFGVFATQLIPRGTIVWVLDPFDLRLAPSVVARYPPTLRAAILRGSYPFHDGHLLMCWDHARQVNHSCRPSCVDVGLSFQIAARTLRPGDELTCDYTVSGHYVAFSCCCEAPDCRGWIPTSSGRVPTEDDELRTLILLAAALPQALLPYASPERADERLLEAFDPDRSTRMAHAVGAR